MTLRTERPDPGAAREGAGLERARAALENDLVQTSLELRRAAEGYDALAGTYRLAAARLREAEADVAALRQERAELVRTVARLDSELQAMRQDRDRVRARLEEVCATRVWRLGSLYWSLLGRLGLLRSKGAAETTPEPDLRAAEVAPSSPERTADPAAAAPAPLPAEAPTRSFGLRRDPAVAGLPDVVCFSIVEWDFLYQRPQQLLTRLADRGHRVFYVSQFFDPGEGAPAAHRLRPRVVALRLRGSSRRLFAEELPGGEEDALLGSLAALREREGIASAVSVVHQPFWWPLARRARSAFGWPVLYDCMDDHAGFSTNERSVAGPEEGILSGADAVAASSRLLERKLRGAGREVVLVPNGCDAGYFESIAPRRRADRPTVGYYGCIADWFDADLVADLAQRRPDWDFLLIGPTYLADLTRLPGLPNVTFPGLVPYGELLAAIERIDVFLLPFRRSPLTDAASPVKAYEIMATGRPLVAVRLPELEAFGDLVRFADDADGFESQVETALREDDPAIVARRRDFARRNSWEARVDVLERLVLSLGEAPPGDAARGAGAR